MSLLPPTFLAQILIKLNISDKHKLITLNIKDLYVNIAIDETIQITKYFLQQNASKMIQHQIVYTLHTILHQNYPI